MKSRDHAQNKKWQTATGIAKKNFFYESFRENRGYSKKLWSTFKNLTGKKTSTGVTLLQDDDSEQIRDPALVAESFHRHFI